MSDSLDWESDGRDWPNRGSSRFSRSGGLRWHVQMAGNGRVLLLLHGTGAATHSWRGLLPLLARHFTVVAPDLPGHGFTSKAPAHLMSLPAMSRHVGLLLRSLDVRPALAVGHSAGGAILARMTLDGRIAPAAMMMLNGALLPLGGASTGLFSAAAKLLAALPPVPLMFAWHASDRDVLRRMLRDTGSALDENGMSLYGRLARNPGHVAAALAMMAHWDLDRLRRDLPRLRVPVTLVAGGLDRMIPPDDAVRLRSILPRARVVPLPGLGHLAHEERPAATFQLIIEMAEESGVLSGFPQAGAA